MCVGESTCSPFEAAVLGVHSAEPILRSQAGSCWLRKAPPQHGVSLRRESWACLLSLPGQLAEAVGKGVVTAGDFGAPMAEMLLYFSRFPRVLASKMWFLSTASRRPRRRGRRSGSHRRLTTPAFKPSSETSPQPTPHSNMNACGVSERFPQKPFPI